MKLVKWLQKFAESYNGTGDIDRFSVADGSMIRDDEASNYNTDGHIQFDSDGMTTPDFGKLNHPSSPNGENSLMTEDGPAWRDKQHLNSPNKQNDSTDKSDMYSEKEIPQSEVSDNQADGTVPGTGIATASYFGLFGKKADLDNDFFLQDSISGGCADSPQTMHDGHPIEELENYQQGINYVSNIDAPHVNTPAGDMILNDHTLVDKKKNEVQKSPEVFKGRQPTSASLFDLFKSAYDSHETKKNDGPEGGGSNQDGNQLLTDDEYDVLLDGKGSNVADIMYPFEVNQKHNRSTHDFGTGDISGDERTMSDKPAAGYSGCSEETDNYSGINPTSFLKMFDKKLCGKCGRTNYNDIRYGLCDKCAFPNKKADYVELFVKTDSKNICKVCETSDYELVPNIRGSVCYKCIVPLKKRADYTGVPPSVNPNSGKDSDDEDSSNTITDLERPSMIDGKQVTENFADKEVDPTVMRKKMPYPNRVEDDDAIHYYDAINSGYGGMGMGGGNGTQSGVDNSN